MKPGARGRTSRIVPFAGALACVALIAPMPGAAVAAKKPTAQGSSSYAYLKTHGIYLNTTVYHGRSWSVYQPQTVERWLGEDGSGRFRTTSGIPEFASPADRKTWEEVGKPEFLAHGFKAHTGDEFFPAGSFDWYQRMAEELSDMGRDPDPETLSRWLLDEVSSGTNGFSHAVRSFTQVEEMLHNPLITAEQRIALGKALALVPGIESLGETSDAIGRKGEGIGAESDNSGAPTLYALVFDPETSEVLATESRGLDANGAMSSTMYLAEGATASRLARPQKHDKGKKRRKHGKKRQSAR